MFRTPNLKTFLVTWFLQPSQFQHLPGSPEEFLTERFLEDIMDGNKSIALVVEEIRAPGSLIGMRVGQDIEVMFKVLTTEEQAKQLIELGYKVRPELPDAMETEWDDPDDGMKWNELLVCVNHATRDRKDCEEWDKPIRLTDDGDPHAPWFKIVGMKRDDAGHFLAIEEIHP